MSDAEMYFNLVVCATVVTIFTGFWIRDARRARRTEREKVRARLLGLMIEGMKQNGPYR